MVNSQQFSDDPTIVYLIIAGSFKEEINAQNRTDLLKDNGINSFVHSISDSGETLYRVQTGAFLEKGRAENHLENIKNAGIQDAYILTEIKNDRSNGDVSSIRGDVILSAQRLDQFVKIINPDAPELGQYYVELGESYGIRGDVAFAQAIKETNYFRFTGTVKASQNNFSGIGSTGPNQRGASFATPREGVLAQIQHLYAYASTAPLPDQFPLVDSRFHLVKRGSAQKWVDLNGKWAVPGDDYGQSILDIYERMRETT